VIQEIAYGSPLYHRTVAFREEHLRRPLGLANSAADLAGEDKQIHIAAIDGSEVIGTVVLKPLSPTLVKLRQMAVAPALRGSGLGGELVRFAERIAWGRGYEVIEMAARLSAQGFYERLGYRAVGDEFVDITIPHVKMTKDRAFDPVTP
jgi:predicted GNAT family N-acyltransferase